MGSEIVGKIPISFKNTETAGTVFSCNQKTETIKLLACCRTSCQIKLLIFLIE
jgi:hypothetical protein